MVYWFNSTPKNGISAETVPARQLVTYDWKVLKSRPVNFPASKSAASVSSTFAVGDSVFVKPPNVRCTSTWPVEIVTGVNSATNVEVNGVPRHVADIRAVPDEVRERVEVEQQPGELEAHPQRERRRPDRFGNNIYDI